VHIYVKKYKSNNTYKNEFFVCIFIFIFLRADKILFWKISVVWTNVSRSVVSMRQKWRIVSLQMYRIAEAHACINYPFRSIQIFVFFFFLIKSNHIPDHELTKFRCSHASGIFECTANTLRALLRTGLDESSSHNVWRKASLRAFECQTY